MKFKTVSLKLRGRYKVFPNELIPNVKIPNPGNGENPKHKNPKILA
jgi:hypothetical protein